MTGSSHLVPSLGDKRPGEVLSPSQTQPIQSHIWVQVQTNKKMQCHHGQRLGIGRFLPYLTFKHILILLMSCQVGLLKL